MQMLQRRFVFKKVVDLPKNVKNRKMFQKFFIVKNSELSVVG
jgi:hypothetical protein